ncbi:MAG: hypothetical protein ACRD3Q_03760 [Terriglobales bacterium]
MSNLTRSVLAALLLSSFVAAQPRHIPAGTLPYKSLGVASWIKSGVDTTSTPLVYVTVLTGLTSGVTDIYEIANGTATLVGQLDIGGGGPIAVDSQQNVYVIAANYDGNLYQQDSHVYVYPRGSITSTFDFDAPGFGAQAMTVDASGNVYMTGQLYPDTNSFGAMKFTAGGTTGQWLPADAQQPIYPTGLAVDSSGNLFAGWYGSSADPCWTGCVDELAAGKKKWKNTVPDLAANSMAAGPFALSDGSLVFWTGVEGRFNYIETIYPRHKTPTQVAQLPPDLFSNGPLTAALNEDGTEIWGTAWGFSGPPGTNVSEIDYPSGNVSFSFPVNDPQEFFLIIGMGVSPTYYP